MRWTVLPGFPAFVIGCVTLADLIAARLLLRADFTRVYLAGHPLNIQCAFQASTGLPCPTCGITRSVVMSLHGQFADAWHMAPAGPVAFAGMVLFGLAMLAFAFLQQRSVAVPTASRWLRQGGLAYAFILTVVWLGGWAGALQSALSTR